MQPRTALLLGNGKYAISLHQRLRMDPKEAALTVALFPEGEAAITNADFCVDVLSPTHVIDFLRRRNITHVIFGGNFRLLHLLGSVGRPKNMRQTFGDPQTYNFFFNWVSGGNSLLLKTFCDFLQANGFTPISASERLPDLRPGEGLLVSAGALSNQSNTDIARLITKPAQLAIGELDNQPWRHVRQAFLFENEQLLLRDAHGTDTLLEKAQAIPRTPGRVRTMVKLCPSGFNARMDPPVVGPKTFQLAGQAGVDLVVLDSERGILFDRAHVAAICAEKGISVYGLKVEPFTRALEQVPASAV